MFAGNRCQQIFFYLLGQPWQFESIKFYEGLLTFMKMSAKIKPTLLIVGLVKYNI